MWRDKPSSHVRRQWRTALYHRQSGRCAYCECSVTIDKTHAYAPNYGTIDHTIPRSKRGASTSLTNMVLACRTCNDRKGAMDADEFRRLIASQRLVAL